MDNLIQSKFKILRFIKFLGRFGVFQGLKAWINVFLYPKESILIQDIKNQIFIRPNTSDKDVFNDVFVDKQYGFPIEFTPKFIIDAGANVGFSAIYFANVYEDSKIICVEIEEGNFELLKKNTKEYNKVYLKQAALWNSETSFTIIDNNFGNWGFTVTEDRNHELEGQKIESITIDQIMKEYNVAYIDILKIDIEGAEKELFSSNYEYWLPKTKVIMVELHDRMKKGCSKSVFCAINNYDFSMEIRGELLIFINDNL